jgi:2',3'-cyclic-nucleotide 2'-phosphodiesterase (5'-nucleotidase family)
MRIKIIFATGLLLLLLFTACSSPQQWSLTSIQGSKIALDSSTEVMADKEFMEFLAPYKLQLEEHMNEVLGFVEVDMRPHKPESLLSNWSADVYLQTASRWLEMPVDLAIVNLGGLRAPLLAGPVTTGNVFELMPFENELVVLWLKGSDLEALLQYFATIGGQGVAGIKMRIRDGIAVDIQVAGRALDPNREYTIATNDYLAEGNDYMSQLTLHTKRVNTGLLIRSIFIETIRREHAAGRPIKSSIEGRIVKNEE